MTGVGSEPSRDTRGALPTDRWDDIPVGKYLGERSITITPELVEQFSAGCLDRHPWYTGSSEFGGPVAPALIGSQEPWRHAGWYPPELRGNLHMRQEWDLFQAIPLGAEVLSRAQVTERYWRRDRFVIVNEVQLCGPSDGRILCRGRTHQSFLGEQPPGEVVDRGRERDPSRRFELRPGARETIDSEALELTPELCLAAADGLTNYHSDPEIARALGFPAVVVQGVFNCNLASALMTRRFGAGWWCGGRLRMNLVNVIWGGDVVVAHLAVHETVPEGLRQRTECEVWVTKADGTVTAIGSASAVEA
ncbi:MAG: hypothetical protein ACYDAY_08645 [Candidatus Dormibacteria bacterium]